MSPDWHATTILSVRRGDRVALGGDGQVTLGTTVMKADAVKVRRLLDGQVLVGFAGSAADGFALLERFEAKLRDHPDNLLRAATELAKLWRTDRLLRPPPPTPGGRGRGGQGGGGPPPSPPASKRSSPPPPPATASS